METMKIATLSSSGTLSLSKINEANVDARNRDKADSFSYTYKTAGSLHKTKGRQITISPIGEVKDKGFVD